MGKGEYTDGKVKVTIRLNPELVKKAKHWAIEQNVSLQELIARALDFREQVDLALTSLTPRQEKVLRMRFGVDDGQARTLRESGATLGLSGESIRQIENQALRKLIRRVRPKKLQMPAARRRTR